MDGQPSCIRQKGEKVGDPNLDSDLKQCVAATFDECCFLVDPEDFVPGCKVIFASKIRGNVAFTLASILPTDQHIDQALYTTAIGS